MLQCSHHRHRHTQPNNLPNNPHKHTCHQYNQIYNHLNFILSNQFKQFSKKVKIKIV